METDREGQDPGPGVDSPGAEPVGDPDGGRRLVHHSPLKRWSPITRAERREAGRFVHRLLEFPYLTAGTVAVLVWFYLVQLAFDWPFAWLLPSSESVADELTMTAVGAHMGWLHPEAIRAGELWRLIASTFLHASVLHIVGNCVVLFFLGRIVENAIGRSAFALTYVGSAISGGLLSTWLVAAPSQGASGAALGMLGAAAAFGWRWKKQIPRALRDYFGTDLWFFILLVAAMSAMPRVDWAGHLGGFLFGCLIGVSWQPRMLVERIDPLNRGMRVVMAALAAFLFAATATLVGLRISTLGEQLPGPDLRALMSAAEQEDMPRMLEASERLLERFPDVPSMREARVRVLLAAERWDEAVDEARRLEPADHPAVLEFQATVGLQARRWAYALRAMRDFEAGEGRPGDPGWNNNFAWALFMGEPDEPDSVRDGLDRIREALRADPDSPVMRNTLGYGLLLAGEAAQAERVAAQLLAGDAREDDAPDRYLRSMALVKLGRGAEALALFVETAQKDPRAELHDEAAAVLRGAGLMPPAEPAP